MYKYLFIQILLLFLNAVYQPPAHRNQMNMHDNDKPGIKLAGEKYVEQWLTDNGYTNIEKENLHSYEPVLIATGSIENILVRVSTFVHPNRIYKLSELEADVLTRRAGKQQLAAYAAYVVIDTNNELVEDIKWDRLQ